MIVALVIFILVAITAFYVAAEFAAVGVRTSRVQQEAEDGNRRAQRLLPYLLDSNALDRYIAACQIGITITSLVVGAYGQATLAPRLVPLFERFGSMQAPAAQSSAAIVVLIGLTIFHMVLGELVPKSVALQAPTRIALLTVIPMQWSLRLMAWSIDWLNGAGNAILRLMRMPASSHRHIHSAEEIAYLVTESGKVGLLKPNEQVRLRHALRLGDRPARELMVPRTAIIAVEVDAPMSEMVAMAIDAPYTRFPVFETSIDEIIGVVHVRDVARVSADKTAATIRDIMRPVLLAPASMRLDRLIARLKEERRTMAVLLDEYGGTAGLITIDNVLDDLIGDIADEFRPARPTPERLADGRIRLPGALDLETATGWTRVTWPDVAETVGGVVVAKLGRGARPGDVVKIHGARVEVESVEGQRIVYILVSPPKEGANA